MSKYVKELIQSELEQKIVNGNVKEFIVLSIKGVDGNSNNEMRGSLKEKGVEVFVVKNSLFRRALRSQEMVDACDLFAGPCAVAIGGDSIVDAAKELTDWGKKVKALQMKGAYLDGTTLDEAGAVNLAKMPTRKELQAQIAGIIMSPAAQVAGAVVGQGSGIAGCIKTIIENAEKDAA
jgi:large subunit ribosomal protein L10